METRRVPGEVRLDPVRLHSCLYAFYGPSSWWPADSPLEVMVGAVLTQNTAWTNVVKAIANLKAACALDLEALMKIRSEELAGLIRPSGYYNLKAHRLKNLVAMVHEEFGGRLDRLFSLDAPELRSVLLAVRGIGRETADSICCYAADKTVFVVDAYTRRILSRHALIREDADYDEIRALFEEALPRRIDVYKDLHAHLVFVGKDFCKRSRPLCGQCPLRDESAYCVPVSRQSWDGTQGARAVEQGEAGWKAST